MQVIAPKMEKSNIPTIEPLTQKQLDKLSRLTFVVIRLVFFFKDDDLKHQPEHVRIFVGDTIVAVANGKELRKSERALTNVPLEIKPKVEMDLKKLEMIYSDSVSFATYYPQESHAH